MPRGTHARQPSLPDRRRREWSRLDAPGRSEWADRDQASDRGPPIPSDRARPGVTTPVAADREATAVERVFREAYGQAVATLIRIFGDITLAEDAVQDAFVAASDRWRRDGIPPNP